MAQKINPISFRLGITQVWNSTIQVYGKSFNIYFLILQKQIQIQEYLIRFFQLNNFLLNYQEWKIHKNKIFLNVYYSLSFYSKTTRNLLFLKQLSELISRWFSNEIFIRFYLKPQWSSTSNLIVAYTQYLLEQKTTPKKIIWNLCKFLKAYMKSTKISYFKFGVLKTSLTGFKIRLSGRFDDSNQMAKKFEQTVGSLSLTNLESFIEYSNKEIPTKSGICGIQVWLFYSI